MFNKIKNYDILSKIASGGMANIYLALDTRTNSRVAIKILKEEVSDKEKILERFAQEGLLNLNHPNIVKILDAGIHESTPYIVMEYIEGVDLEDYIRNNGALPVDKAMDIYLQILSALAYIHSQGVIHRDIKPRNIIIDKTGSAKLTDFGIAKSLYSHIKTSTGGYLGAPAYSSPEQMDGDSVDERADIYSLGITLYEMITGSTPYSSTSLNVIIKEKFEGKHIPINKNRNDLPIYLEKIYFKSTSKLPENRFSSAKEILDLFSERSEFKASGLLNSGNQINNTIIKKEANMQDNKNNFQKQDFPGIKKQINAATIVFGVISAVLLATVIFLGAKFIQNTSLISRVASKQQQIGVTFDLNNNIGSQQQNSIFDIKNNNLFDIYFEPFNFYHENPSQYCSVIMFVTEDIKAYPDIVLWCGNQYIGQSEHSDYPNSFINVADSGETFNISKYGRVFDFNIINCSFDSNERNYFTELLVEVKLKK